MKLLICTLATADDKLEPLLLLPNNNTRVKIPTTLNNSLAPLDYEAIQQYIGVGSLSANSKIFESMEIHSKSFKRSPTSSQYVTKARLLGHFDRKRDYLTHGSHSDLYFLQVGERTLREERNDGVSRGC